MWDNLNSLNPLGSPVCVCDVCLRPITSSDPGGPMIPRHIRLGAVYVVKHAHVGLCHDLLEERMAKDANAPPRHTQPE
jgi:hypothetical protein